MKKKVRATRGGAAVARDQSQAWFWTERWQEMEREAEADIRAGCVRRFDGVEEMFKHLDG